MNTFQSEFEACMAIQKELTDHELKTKEIVAEIKEKEEKLKKKLHDATEFLHKQLLCVYVNGGPHIFIRDTESNVETIRQALYKVPKMMAVDVDLDGIRDSDGFTEALKYDGLFVEQIKDVSAVTDRIKWCCSKKEGWRRNRDNNRHGLRRTKK